MYTELLVVAIKNVHALPDLYESVALALQPTPLAVKVCVMLSFSAHHLGSLACLVAACYGVCFTVCVYTSLALCHGVRFLSCVRMYTCCARLCGILTVLCGAFSMHHISV